MYDAIIVGARCAGASTAMLLARKGHRVLLVDRARFPSDIPQGHFIHQQGPLRLQRWGLLDRIKASGCPAVESAVLDLGDFGLRGERLSIDDVAIAYGPRRLVLDKILLEAAIAAGAEMRECCPVEGFLTDGDRIVGIRGRDRNGNVFTEHASVVVGADGRNSRLAHAVKAPVYEEMPTLTCFLFSYWSGVPERGLRMHVGKDRAVFGFPTHDNLFAVFAAMPINEAKRVMADSEGSFMATAAIAPELADMLRNGHREERFYGAADLPNFFRKPFGPGWALVGDAGHHKDPYMALGVNDALRDADFLSDALDETLSGRADFDTALAAYERRRNETALPLYRENLNSAQFVPLPQEAYQLRAAMRGNPDVTREFFLARFGRTPRESFFNPENLQRVMQGYDGAPSGPVWRSNPDGERIPTSSAK